MSDFHPSLTTSSSTLFPRMLQAVQELGLLVLHNYYIHNPRKDRPNKLPLHGASEVAQKKYKINQKLKKRKHILFGVYKYSLLLLPTLANSHFLYPILNYDNFRVLSTLV